MPECLVPFKQGDLYHLKEIIVDSTYVPLHVYYYVYIFKIKYSNSKVSDKMIEKYVLPSLEMLLNQQPELKEITNSARTAYWYQLGVQLELDGVRLDECTDLARMYNLWIQQKAENATRRNLLTALRAIRENNVAKQYEDYLKELLVSF